MKIKTNQPGALSALFQARANPWAPKYEHALWNDFSEPAYEMTLKRYNPVLSAAAKVLGIQIDRPAHVAQLLRLYSDDLLNMITRVDPADIKRMRGDLMHFLDTTGMSTNCYAYGLDIRRGFKPGDLLTPGYLSQVGGDCSQTLANKNISTLFDGLAKDGFEFFNGHPNRDRPPEGFYLTALLIHHDDTQPGKIKDFHFVRYDRDGGCSHKLGHSYVGRSYVGKDIIDPMKPGSFGDYKYEGCILVPSVLPQYNLP